MTPQQVLKNLVAAVLAWEEADAHRIKVLDSKRATPRDVQAANTKLASAIGKLRTATTDLRKLLGSAPKKKTKNFDWLKALDITTKVLNGVKNVTDKQSLRLTDVIDVTGETVSR